MNQEIGIADIIAGKLTFDPVANANGTGYSNFQFKVSDGTLYSTSSYTETINVTAVNDAPIAQTFSVSGLEDVTLLVQGWKMNDVEDGNNVPSSVVITSLPSHGTLLLSWGRRIHRCGDSRFSDDTRSLARRRR